MLKPVLNRNIVLACFADCPADNHAPQLAQFLYETLCVMLTRPKIRLHNSKQLCIKMTEFAEK